MPEPTLPRRAAIVGADRIPFARSGGVDTTSDAPVALIDDLQRA